MVRRLLVWLGFVVAGMGLAVASAHLGRGSVAQALTNLVLGVFGFVLVGSAPNSATSPIWFDRSAATRMSTIGPRVGRDRPPLEGSGAEQVERPRRQGRPVIYLEVCREAR